MSKRFERLENDEIVSISSLDLILMPHVTFRVSEFIEQLATRLEFFGEKWQHSSGEGIDSQVWRPGAGWRKGKVRLILEFLPDDSEVEETR